MYIYSSFLLALLLLLLYRNRNIFIFAKLKISYAIPCSLILSFIFYNFTKSFEFGDYIMLLFISPLYLINIVYIIISSIIILYLVSKCTGIGSDGIFTSLSPIKSLVLWENIKSIEIITLDKKIIIKFFDLSENIISKQTFNKRVLPYIEQKFSNLPINCKYI